MASMLTRSNRTPRRRAAGALFAGPVAGLLAGLVATAAAAAPSATTPPAQPKTHPPAKSLDELLGIEGRPKGEVPPPTADEQPPPADGAGEGALERARERVRRALDEQEVDGILKEILAGMRSSATRLAERSDPGLPTQRVQQEVIDRLDILIDQAQRRRHKSGSQSSSQRQRALQERAASSESAAMPADGTSREGERQQRSGDRQMDPPPGEDPTDLDRMLDETRSEWGALPARVREMIRQGRRDGVASIYQRMTEEYYRRMAEDATR
jgi:hypothetical protein